MTDRAICPSKEELVTYLYGEGEAGLIHDVERHLADCSACRTEVEALSDVRVSLTAWSAPDLRGHVQVVPGRSFIAPARLRAAWRPSLALAAAATVVVGIAAGLANLEVRYGSDGLVIRTGWRSPVEQSQGATGTRAVQAGAVPVAAGDRAAWRDELAALEARLRRELRPDAGVERVSAGTADPRSMQTLDAEALKRFQALIDASEIRQQRNLALRMTELARDFDLQRKADLVQIQQGLGVLEGRSAAERREILDYLVRVSQQQQREPR